MADDDRLPETENWVQSTQLNVNRRHALVGGAALAGYALAVQPVEAAIVTPDTGLDAGMITFPTTGGLAMNAYRARPKGKRNLPVILVVQEIFGVHEWIKDVTRRFARAGYYAIAPDLYQRQGDATKIADFKQLFPLVASVPDAQVMGDLDAALAFAGKDGGNAVRVGITGFCWGGRITWLYAEHNPKLKAGVAWYGRLAGKPTELQPKNPIDLIASLRAPVLGLYGGLDKGIPVSDVDKMREALKVAKKPGELVVFPQADHGFLADYRPSYNEPAAKDGWAKALAHFKRHV